MAPREKVKLETYRDLQMEGLLRRRVDVWLPPNYHDDEDARFPVLYMNDGQNLFRSTRLIGEGWQVAQTLTSMHASGRVDIPIVVGISSTLNRLGDYLPQKPMQSAEAQAFLKEQLRGNHWHYKEIASDRYLRYLVEVVKPFIDGNYRTKPESSTTGIMGSSMGGLISLYALCEYPQVFGLAGCLSTHWPITGKYMLDYLRQHLPPADGHKLYFDIGDQDLDAAYAPWQAQVDEILKEKGWEENRDWQSWYFPGEGHHERFWANRLHLPLGFLFPAETY